MSLPTPLALILILSGVWTLIVWPPFLRRIFKDPRSKDEQGAPTRFLKVHFMLISTSMILGLATLVIGIRTLVS
ncbi:SCO4848 family membrane protein [Arthrobacter flavus]|uniref:SCO4848 family membrane protein n=1 Tax=Arthrobacter flavus TaxID=95172 RepID=A0ABW4Q8W0_9MICC